MSFARPATRQTREQSSPVETRSRALAKRAADVEPRAIIGRNRLRSADARRSGENGVAGLVPGKKRKAEMLEDGSKASVTSPLRALPMYGKQRKHKVPKYTSPATRDISRESSSRSTSNTHDNPIPFPIAKDASLGSDSTLAMNETKLRFTRRRMHPTKKSDREPRETPQEYLEAEGLRKELVVSQMDADRVRKTVQEQRKALETLKRELVASKRMNRKQGNQIDKLKSSNKRSEDQLDIVQANLQCQICLEILSKPHTLVPCGHVFCQGCLQNWFRSAPRQPGEDESEDIPTVWRVKTCPCCRSAIHNRPVPLFLLKNVIAAFASNDQNFGRGMPSEIDPWEDIFPEDVDITDSEVEDVIDLDDSDSDVDSTSSDDERYIGLRIFSDGEIVIEGSDAGEEDEDESASVDSDIYHDMQTPPWAPARHRNEITRRIYPHVSPERLQLMQRGATSQMIERFNMRLDRDEGLVIWARNGAEIYLGWNISLPFDDFPDGRIFMSWVENNIIDYPGNWEYDDREDHAVFRRLVPQSWMNEVLGPHEDYDDYEDEDAGDL